MREVLSGVTIWCLQQLHTFKIPSKINETYFVATSDMNKVLKACPLQSIRWRRTVWYRLRLNHWAKYVFLYRSLIEPTSYRQDCFYETLWSKYMHSYFPTWNVHFCSWHNSSLSNAGCQCNIILSEKHVTKAEKSKRIVMVRQVQKPSIIYDHRTNNGVLHNNLERSGKYYVVTKSTQRAGCY